MYVVFACVRACVRVLLLFLLLLLLLLSLLLLFCVYGLFPYDLVVQRKICSKDDVFQRKSCDHGRDFVGPCAPTVPATCTFGFGLEVVH